MEYRFAVNFGTLSKYAAKELEVGKAFIFLNIVLAIKHFMSNPQMNAFLNREAVFVVHCVRP